MKFSSRLSVLTLALGFAACSFAQQGWGDDCIDPANTQPRSIPYTTDQLGNALMQMGIGISGTVAYEVCFGQGDSRTIDGRYGFQVGNVGSLQTDFDNNMALTQGMPNDPGPGPAGVTYILKAAADGGVTPVLFGSGGLAGHFQGASNRYMVSVWRDADVEVELLSRSLADAIRLRWRLRNLSANALSLGMRTQQFAGFRTGGADNQGHNQANTLLNAAGSTPRPALQPNPNGDFYVGYTETPNGRPFQTEKNFLAGGANFPEWIKFQWSQSQPFGLRLDMSPTTSTPDSTPVDQLSVVNLRSSIATGGTFNEPTPFSGRVSTDFGTGDPLTNPAASPIREDSDRNLTDVCYVQGYRPASVAVGQSRDIVQYYRTAWGIGDYLDPYSVVIDAPRLIETSSGGTNGLTPNPMTIIAYLDNQYAQIDQSVTLQNVRFRMKLDPDSGLRLATGESVTKTVGSVLPNQIVAVSWQVEVTGEKIGKLPYKVEFQPQTGGVKTLSGEVLVSATPRMRLPEGASLVTIPWDFADTSLNSIFGPVGDPNALTFGEDFVAYKWDSNTGTYQPATSATRGDSLWIVFNEDFGSRDLFGATQAADTGTGAPITRLDPGWNQIGNPYSFAIPLSQLVGVYAGDPGRSQTWTELVNGNLVSASLAFWKRTAGDPVSGDYEFTQGNADTLQPGTGYWIYNSTLEPIDIVWPPVFAAGLSSAALRGNSKAGWRQSDKQWRLQLAARTASGVDAQNFVGVTTSAKQAQLFSRREAPAAPGAKVELSIREDIQGKPTRMAASFADRSGKRTWSVFAKANEAGEVTVTWPNIGSVPRNVRLTMKDASTNTTRDLRFQSSYTFNMEEPGTRELTLTMEPAGISRALIGDVSVTRPSRDANGPVQIRYTLSSEAVTSVRVLSGSGKEVYTVSRGRSASTGENTAVWNLRDNANRAVAPGTYQVEIVADPGTGDRVRRLVPINIVR